MTTQLTCLTSGWKREPTTSVCPCSHHPRSILDVQPGSLAKHMVVQCRHFSESLSFLSQESICALFSAMLKNIRFRFNISQSLAFRQTTNCSTSETHTVPRPSGRICARKVSMLRKSFASDNLPTSELLMPTSTQTVLLTVTTHPHE